MRKINQAGIELIKLFEGLETAAYRCPAGKWTIGYGSTGKHVKPGMRITPETAEELLRIDLERFESAVERATRGVDTTDNQFGAFVSLFFNLGEGWIPKATCMALHKQGKTQAAADAFLRFNKANGKVLAGLTRRRQAERRLYLTP